MKKKYFLILILFFLTHLSAQDIKPILSKAFTSKDSSDYYFKLAKKKIKNQADLAQFYFCKSARLGDFNQNDSAVYYGQKAIKILENKGDLNSLLTVYANLNNVYTNQGKYDQAIAYSIKGLKRAEKEKKDDWIVHFNSKLAIDYHDYESYEKGIYYGKKALKILEQKKEVNKDFLWSALNAIAINFDDWNKPDSALFYHKKIIQYFKGKDTLKIASTYNNIGNTLLKQKKYKEAKYWLLKGLKISELNDLKATHVENTRLFYEKATLFTNLATIETALNHFDQAKKLFDQAYSFATKSMSAEKLKDLYAQRAKFYTKINQFQLASQDHESYIKIRDSVFEAKRAKTVVELEAKYQNEKKEKELLISKSKIATKEHELKEKKIQFLILILISISLLIIVFLIYKQYRFKTQQQKQEFELREAIAAIETQNKLQEQRLQISRDLHDNIGSQLTFIISSVDNIRYAFDTTNKQLENKLSGISDFARTTIVELRDTIWAMNKSKITFEDFQTRLSNFIEKAKTTHEEIQFSINIEEKLKKYSFTSVDGMNIYRTIQEAVHNSVKHAEASVIKIEMKIDKETILVIIEDNGTGFSQENLTHINGLNIMQQRIKDCNGTLKIESVNGKGTKISIDIPMMDNKNK